MLQLAQTGFLRAFANQSLSLWRLEIGHDPSIYTTEAYKHANQGFCILESRFSGIPFQRAHSHCELQGGFSTDQGVDRGEGSTGTGVPWGPVTWG